MTPLSYTENDAFYQFILSRNPYKDYIAKFDKLIILLGKNERDNILELVNVKKYFPIKRGFKQILRLVPPAYVKAVDDVSFQLKRGNVFVIAGESGSGKSTLARIILKAVQPDAGFIYLNCE